MPDVPSYMQCTARLTLNDGGEVRCDKDKTHWMRRHTTNNAMDIFHQAERYTNDSPENGNYIVHVTTAYIW